MEVGKQASEVIVQAREDGLFSEPCVILWSIGDFTRERMEPNLGSEQV